MDGASSCAPSAFALRSARLSQCPSYAWMAHIAPTLAAIGGGHVALLNVGANKGFDLLTFLEWYTETNVTKQMWLQLAEDRNGTARSGAR